MAHRHRMPSAKSIKPIFVVGGVVAAVCLLSSSMTASGFMSGVRAVFSSVATPSPATHAVTTAPAATLAPTQKPVVTMAPEKTSRKPFPHGNVVGV